MNYSLTQGGNLLALAGAITLILKYFKIETDQNEIAGILGAVATILGFAISWYGRYRNGGVTVAGFKTTADPCND